ncbi:sensor histidine kinase [Paenibacillus sp. YIM B09110]|uniref:sensor histidine kinase n=1 Tax=Paenibacillus sp. YIM B09110 TaxID=3126102 RepID=UPI00301E3340
MAAASKRQRRMIPFGYKLMASYVVIVLIPVILIGYFAYTTSVKAITEHAKSTIQGTLTQTKENMMYQIDQLQRTSDQLYWDYALQDDLRLNEYNWTIYDKTMKSIVPKLQNAINLTPNRALLKFYITNKTYPEIYAVPTKGSDPLLLVDSFELFHMDRIMNTYWFKSFQTSEVDGEKIESRSYWRQIEEDARYDNISLLRPMFDYKKQKQIGFMRIIARMKDIAGSADYRKFGDKSSVIILNENDRIIHASSKETSYPAYATWTEELTRGHLTVVEKLPNVDWTIIALIPHKDLSKEADKVKWLTVLICLGSFIVLSSISLFISRFFSVRVTKIIRSLNAFREGRFDKRIQYSGNDEFFQIAEAFNDMGRHINSLIKEVYEVRLEKKEAELEALQAQINPHFLYNTLSSISRLGKFGEIDKLDQMVTGLAKFYRLTLNQGKFIIPVEKEIEQAKTYIEIQKIKYGSRVEVMYDIEADVYGYDTVKLVLQPFIENILEHALFQSCITIKLCAYREKDAIVFKIIDDGVGMKPQHVHAINQRSGGDQAGYGIRNVDERIKLQFGPQYGVEIGSRFGAGTTVLIRIPLYKEKKFKKTET